MLIVRGPWKQNQALYTAKLKWKQSRSEVYQISQYSEMSKGDVLKDLWNTNTIVGKYQKREGHNKWEKSVCLWMCQAEKT